jgi:hypothetical protein
MTTSSNCLFNISKGILTLPQIAFGLELFEDNDFVYLMYQGKTLDRFSAQGVKIQTLMDTARSKMSELQEVNMVKGGN